MKDKFCTNCQVSKPVEKGVYILSGKIRRWKCLDCVKKIHLLEGKKCATIIATKAETALVRIGEEI